MLRTRVLTAVVLLALLLPLVYFAPTRWFAGVCLACMALCLREWLKLLDLAEGPRWAALAMLLACGLALIADGWFAPEDAIVYVMLPAAFVWLIFVPLTLARHATPRGGSGVVFAWWACLACFLALWAARSESLEFLLSVLLLVWVADTAAYFTGRALGRHKLAPSISPGKTWEGVLGAVVANLVWVLWAEEEWAGSWPAWTADAWGLDGLVMITALITAVSVMADLHESLLKRQAQVKDSGGLLPGHGGVFDRLDALLATTPLAVLFAWPGF